MLLEEKANAVMDQINDVLLQDDVNPFQYSPLNTRILSGEEEGVFAWISLNYLNGFFDRHAGERERERETGEREREREREKERERDTVYVCVRVCVCVCLLGEEGILIYENA